MSNLGIELKRRARALVAGATLSAATLAMIPGAAQAQILDGTVDGAANGKVKDNGAATVDSGSTTEQNAAGLSEPRLDGATESTTEANAPVVPAQGDATVEGNVAAGDVVTEDVCLNAGLNAPAGSCGAPATAPATGADPSANPGAPVVDADASGFENEQYVAEPGQPLLDGTTDGVVGVSAPAVPAQAGVAANQYVAAGDLVREDLCLDVALNQAPGTCDPTATGGGIPAPTQGAPLVDGQANGGTDLDAPAVPVEGSAVVDQYAAVGEVARLDACLDATINAASGACEAAPAAVDAPVDFTPAEERALDGEVVGEAQVDAPAAPVQAGTGIEADAALADLVGLAACVNAGVNQETGSCETTENGDDTPSALAPNPIVEGDVRGEAGVGAPAVPVQSGNAVDSDVAADGLAEIGVCIGAAINQAPGTCGEAAPEDGEVPADGRTPAVVDGDVDGAIEVDAPAAPVQSDTAAQSDIMAEELAELGVCLGAGLNQDPKTCRQADSTPSDGAGAPGNEEDPTDTPANEAGSGSGNAPGEEPRGDAGAPAPGGNADSDGNTSGTRGNDFFQDDVEPSDAAGEDRAPATEQGDTREGSAADETVSTSGIPLFNNVDVASGAAPAESSATGTAGSEGADTSDEQAASSGGSTGGEVAGSADSPDTDESRPSSDATSGSLPDTGGLAILPLLAALLLGIGILGLASRGRRNL